MKSSLLFQDKDLLSQIVLCLPSQDKQVLSLVSKTCRDVVRLSVKAISFDKHDAIEHVLILDRFKNLRRVHINFMPHRFAGSSVSLYSLILVKNITAVHLHFPNAPQVRALQYLSHLTELHISRYVDSDEDKVNHLEAVNAIQELDWGTFTSLEKLSINVEDTDFTFAPMIPNLKFLWLGQDITSFKIPDKIVGFFYEFSDYRVFLDFTRCTELRTLWLHDNSDGLRDDSLRDQNKTLQSLKCLERLESVAFYGLIKSEDYWNEPGGLEFDYYPVLQKQRPSWILSDRRPRTDEDWPLCDDC